MNKYFETLELHKILQKLSELCSNSTSKKLALEIDPSTDIDDVRREVERTDNALKRALPARVANGCSFSVLFHFLYSVIHPLCFPAIIAHEQIPDDESYS